MFDHKKWYQENKERVLREKNERYWIIKDKYKETWKRQRLARIEKKPWLATRSFILARCSNHPRYYGKGIKNFLTIKDLEYLWFRDKAFTMERPSIDRINPVGNYILDNCRYLEWKDNKAFLRGRWSRKHSKCQECGTTKSEHCAKGLCYSCYERNFKWRWASRKRNRNKKN